MQYTARVSEHGTAYSIATVRKAIATVTSTLLAVSSGYCLRHVRWHVGVSIKRCWYSNELYNSATQ
jgi:hypothetical protein